MTYNNLSRSAIISMNYLFLRYAFNGEKGAPSQLIMDELQNFMHAFPDREELFLDTELKDILRTELIEGEYCLDLTKQEARHHFILALQRLLPYSGHILQFYMSLLDDDDYASKPKELYHEPVLDRNDAPVLPNTMVVFDQSISQEPFMHLVHRINGRLYIRRGEGQPFVELSPISNNFRVSIPEDNRDYIKGWGCPRCFSDDTTTLLASRENTCNRCGLEFPLPEEEARGNEDEDTRYALSQLTLDAQVKAYIDELAVLAKAGVEPPSCFPSFLEPYNSDEFFYDAHGNVKPPIDVS